MNAGHVYVLAFDNGTVKVGQTQNASQRLSSHRSIAKGFGLTVTKEWVSPPHVGWRANEDALKAIATDLGGTPTSQEYFNGIDFDDVVEKAEVELTFTTPESAAESPAQPTDKPPQTARDRAIRDHAIEWVEEALAQEVTAARLFLDLGRDPEVMYGIGGVDRIGDIMRLILNHEKGIKLHYDTVMAIQRQLTGSDA
jgi:hypothetical protein